MERVEDKVRIYVGGLGESVSSHDLHSIFSKVGGQIQSLQIIRTKGRSFAYIDFLPSSHNSISKLFSTYNGCVWKGGRLRLEKAKEHYLDCLKREWAEDAQLASTAYTTDVNDGVEVSESPKKELSSEKKQLRVFFPRLGKVKSLPFSGTGKHKYSFRRVEVPSLPTHFCDCEEHSGPLHTAEEKRILVLETQGGGVNKEELDMMNSVMNKLFEMENLSSTEPNDIELIKEEDYFIKVTDDPQSDESERYSIADDDNLIINVVSRGQETAFTDQKSKLNTRQGSEDRPTQDVLERQTRNRNRNNRNESASAVSGHKGSLQAYVNGPGDIVEAQHIELQSGAKQSAPSLSWSQKSSWTELIGDQCNSAINISDILLGIPPDKEEQFISDSILNSKNIKKKKLSRHENHVGQLEDTEVKGLAETQPFKQDSTSNKTGRGSAWLNKASWTQLVTNNISTSFSITQILPGLTFEKQEPVKPDDVIFADSRDCACGDITEKGKYETVVDGKMGLAFGRDCDTQSTLDLSQLIVTGNNDTSVPTENGYHWATKQASVSTENKYSSATKQASASKESKNSLATKQSEQRTSTGGVVIGETCSFMRTDASLREWANTKAALTGSRKRKR